MKMNTHVISDRVLAILHRCQNTLTQREDTFFNKNIDTLTRNLDQIGKAFSGSYLGYHADVYYRDFTTPAPGDHFSSEWGLMEMTSNPSSENWGERSSDQVRTAAFKQVDADYEARLKQISDHAAQVFDEGRDTLLTIVGVLLDREKTNTLERLRGEIQETKGRVSAHDITQTMMPQGGFMSRDMTAISQGVRVPTHVAIQAKQIFLLSPFSGLESLVKSCRNILSYMEIHELIDKGTVQKAERVFIGHGHSPIWRELKDFLQDRLHLSWDEFEREPIAGQATSERLQTMLDTSCFAFLVMTAEDIHADKSVHARENVVHEAGLFQGQLGFKKAILLLEDGCSEFSNIEGLGQLRFPRGNIAAIFEEIRRVLEREKII